jgi:glycine/D-amino acid oxidase-like deaminating enzyme
MKQPSFWEKETFLKSYDLIIIGAGITGLSSALFYRRHHPGARILVLDKGSIPEGASTRNAGFACVGSITEHVSDMEKETEEKIKERIQRRYRGLHLLRRTLGDTAIDYENCGGYEIFTETREFEEAREHIPQFNDRMKELCGEEEIYQPKELNGYDAIYNRLEGALHPGKMMQVLLNKVTESGTAVRWNAIAKNIDDQGSVSIAGAAYDKSGFTLEADQILVAANGFSAQLLSEVPIKPARGLVMVSEPWHDDMPWKGTFSYDRGYVYFRNVGNRLLLGGGRNAAIEEETTHVFGNNETIKNYLQTFARETLHMPDEIEFEYEWSGIMGFTPTKTPVLKRLDDHRVIAAGLSGMGIAIGMEVGKQAVGLLNDK